MAKRKKRPVPIALLWTRRDQLRFTSAVERFCAAVGDLETAVRELKAAVARKPRRKPGPAADNGAAAGPALP
jgi:hypothetical protein